MRQEICNVPHLLFLIIVKSDGASMGFHKHAPNVVVFHVYFLKKYVHEPNHVIEWDVIQVEPDGELQIKTLCIINKKVTLL